jgi:hypothetical protein
MVSKSELLRQFKKINFYPHGWGRSEAMELQNVILPGEEIYECVNGMYDGGFALFVATDIRVLLIDKKPLNFLTVEDMRFDNINELDYNHRLIGAAISITCGSKNLRFRSMNQEKLRKLIGHVQHCMAQSKQKEATHQDTQVSHLEQINMQLQAYLSAQQQYQQQLQQSDGQDSSNSSAPAPPKPSNELADYLYAQSLLAQHQDNLNKMQQSSSQNQPEPKQEEAKEAISPPPEPPPPAPIVAESNPEQSKQVREIYAEGVKEIFGEPAQAPTQPAAMPVNASSNVIQSQVAAPLNASGKLEINPMHIAYSKLPMALRNRKFTTPSLPPISPAGTQTPEASGPF